MSYFNTLASLGAVLLGLLLTSAGFYARRGRRLHQRQGAEVLAGLGIFLGIVLMCGSAALVLLSLR
jgi:hypothetical protein